MEILPDAMEYNSYMSVNCSKEINIHLDAIIVGHFFYIFKFKTLIDIETCLKYKKIQNSKHINILVIISPRKFSINKLD